MALTSIKTFNEGSTAIPVRSDTTGDGGVGIQRRRRLAVVLSVFPVVTMAYRLANPRYTGGWIIGASKPLLAAWRYFSVIAVFDHSEGAACHCYIAT